MPSILDKYEIRTDETGCRRKVISVVSGGDIGQAEVVKLVYVPVKVSFSNC